MNKKIGLAAVVLALTSGLTSVALTSPADAACRRGAYCHGPVVR